MEEEINWKIKEPTPQLPKILYKYRDIDNPNHLETLKEQTLFLSSAYRFNDPFDCKIPLEFMNMVDDEKRQRKFAKKVLMMHGTEDVLAKIDKHVDNVIAKGILNDKKYLSKLEENDVKELNEKYGIYSLSAVANNLLLWSHYANCHKGVCIGFNAKQLQERCEFSAGGPVTYFTQYPNMSVLRDNEDLFYNQLFNKSTDWLYEKEFRYIKIGGADTKIRFPAEIIEEINIGCMTSTENERLIKKLKKEKYPKARIFKCKKSKKGYFLEREEV